jgi:hypothetical protein
MNPELRVIKSDAKKPIRKPAKRRKSKAITAIQKTSVERYAIMATTLALLAVSLFDLSEGIDLLTNCGSWRAWAMAIGIDCLFVAIEYSVLKQGRDMMANALTVLTLVMSAALNARAMTHGVFDIDHGNAIALGLFIPAALFLATHRLGVIK